MERNLQMLKIIIEHRRNEIVLAEMNGDWEKKAALETEVKDLKVRQARLSCALWVQPEDLPSSMQLLESENPQQLQQELELLLEKLGLVPPRHVFDARELVAPTLEQAQAIAEIKQESEPAPEPAPAVVPALASVARDAESLQQQTLPLTGLRLPLRPAQSGEADSPCSIPPRSPVQKGPRPHTPRRTSSNQKGKEGKGGSGKAGADLFGKGTAAVAGPSGPNKDASAGQRFVEVREEPGSHEGAGSPGKASVKGPPGKGKGGKKGPPMPSEAVGAADGKGKGQKGPALPAGKGGRIRKVTPLGRRFHWKELPADKLKGTVFDDIHASNSLEVQFDGLKNYFADDDELGKAPGASASSTKDDGPITVFETSRTQNIAIVLRGIFGQMPTTQETEALAMGLEAVDAARAGPVAHCLDAERTSLLPTAMPTAEEAAQLLSHPAERLRNIERLVLPLARLPRARQRVRALHLSANAERDAAMLQGRLDALGAACHALRGSLALRRFLRTVAKLGSWINSSDPEMEKGFAVSSALGKLRLFRALRKDKAVSLLHMALLAAAGGEVAVLQGLCSSFALELEALEPAAREDLADLDKAIQQFAAEEAWLLAEADDPANSIAVRAKLRAIHQELVLPARHQLQSAWAALRIDLGVTLRYFAEAEAPTFEAAAEQLFQTLHAFQKDVATASSEILSQPRRFLKAYAAGGHEPEEQDTATGKNKIQPRSSSVPSVSKAGRQLRKLSSLADRVAQQNSTSNAALAGNGGSCKVQPALLTEANGLCPDQWWPQLWSKYSELQKAEVLGGLLWQLAPSHRCSRQSLYELEELAKRLPRNVLHIFEFRHSSWYGAHRDDVVNLLRRWGLCLAWIHIQNSDGWCGDLEDGWPSLARTCNSAYLRLFGTKQKAIGRYGEEMIRETILPMVQGPGAPTDSFVVFAQADVPDHAKADAAFMVELLGRTDSQPGRSARWERDVLVATLGLGVGMQVTGVVQRITHRTVFVDIGRSCRAFLDANHARRAGLLESLRIGTHVEGLEVQHLDFQGEWGIVGLSCHKAFVSLGAAEEEARASAPAEAEIAEIEDPNQTAKRSRWLRQGTGESSDAFCSEAGASPAAVAVAALAEEEHAQHAPRQRQRWAHRTFEGLAEIGKTSGSRHVVQTPVEELEEQARVKRMAARAKRDERTSRWARALVEKAIDQQQVAEAKKKIESKAKVASQRTSAKRSRSEGPAPRTRREVALAECSRAETKKAQEETMSRAERRKGAGKESDEVPGDWTPNLWSSGQVLPGEPGNGPMAVSTDEFLLMQLEQREGEETQCDEKNFETFGEVSYQQGDWNAEQMFMSERVVTRKRVWRAGALPSPLEPGVVKVGRNKMGALASTSPLSHTRASYPQPVDDEAEDAENSEQAESVAEEAVMLADVADQDSQEVAAEEHAEEDEEEDWQVLQSMREELEEAWEDELEQEGLDADDHPLPSTAKAAPTSSFQAWVPRLRVSSSSSWADATDEIQDSDVAEDSRDAPKGNDDTFLEEEGQAVETVREATGEDEPCLEHPLEHPLDEEGVEEAPLDLPDRRGTFSESPSADEAPQSAPVPQKSHSEYGFTRSITDKDEDGGLRRGWRGRSKPEIPSASLEDSRPEAADDSSEDETILATQLLAEAEASDANPDRARHTARCVLCGMAYSLNLGCDTVVWSG
ncbi:FMNL1 [Symbiodinium sp. CCMP2456]|nr:FMNL1 [Symbiodinium sp. CCMP2456]